MAMQYTGNFNLPYGDECYRNWGAVWNGIAIDIDKLLKEARSPIINRQGTVLSSRVTGKVIFNRYNPD